MRPQSGDLGTKATENSTSLAADGRTDTERMRDMIACTVHELRTPVLGIRILADELRGDGAHAAAPQLEAMDEICEHMLALIEDLLVFEKSNVGKIRIRHDRLALDRLLESIRNNLSPIAHRKGLSLTVEMADDLPRIIRADGLRLRQILQNLVANALKFTRQGGVTIRALRRENALHVEVIDTGEGISKKDQAKLFKRFSQLGSKSDKAQGTGLGLAICDQLATMMGGTVGVQSEPGKGSSFWVNLPDTVLDGLTTKEVGRRKKNQHQDRQCLMHPSRILIVEDHPLTLDVLSRLLMQRGQAVLTARDAAEALHICEGTFVDVVICDLQLPDASGFDLARLLSESRSSAPAKLLIGMSAHITDQNRKDASGAGFLALIDKRAGPVGMVERILTQITLAQHK